MRVLVTLAGPLVAAAVLATLTWGIRRAFRFRRPLRVSAARRQELEQLVRRVDRQTVLPGLVLCLGCPVLVVVALDHVAAHCQAGHPGTLYLIDPVTPRATWLKYAIPVGAVWGFSLASWLCTGLFVACFGRRTTTRYIVGGRLRFGMRYDRAWHVCLTALAVACAPLAVLEVDWYTKVDEDGVVINDFWDLGGRRYTYDQVDQVLEVSHLLTKTGDVVERPQFYVLFADGHDLYMEIAFEEYEPAMRHVARKSGKPLRRVRFIEDARGR